MMQNYLGLAYTPTILDLQDERGSRGLYDTSGDGASELADEEIAHIKARDSLYLATVGEHGWPYVQHRGGDTGFVKILGSTTIGWVERSGNRQYVGTGNIRANGRVAMILVDYAARTRLKLYGHATYHPEPSDELLAELDGATLRNDGAITVDVVATAWNCPKYITPRIPMSDVQSVVDDLQSRIAELEDENRRLAAH